MTTVEATATMNQSRQHQEHQKKVDPLVPEHEVAPEEDYEARTIDKSGGEDGQGQSPFEQEVGARVPCCLVDLFSLLGKYSMFCLVLPS